MLFKKVGMKLKIGTIFKVLHLLDHMIDDVNISKNKKNPKITSEHNTVR